MANKKISEMPIATELKGVDLIPIVQDGVNKAISGALVSKQDTIQTYQLKDYLTYNRVIGRSGGIITKVGNQVFIQGQLLVAMAVGNNIGTVLCTLPEGLRPKRSLSFPVTDCNYTYIGTSDDLIQYNYNAQKVAFLTIKSDGTIICSAQIGEMNMILIDGINFSTETAIIPTGDLD